jgi:hypothetical protein
VSNGVITSPHIVLKPHNALRTTFNWLIWKLCKKKLFSHGKWSHLHPKGVNINQIFVWMMKTISHKVIILCQCINVNMDFLLACLGVSIVALLDHVSILLAYFWLQHSFFNLKKWKLLEMRKLNRTQSYNMHQEKYYSIVVNILNIKK